MENKENNQLKLENKRVNTGRHTHAHKCTNTTKNHNMKQEATTIGAHSVNSPIMGATSTEISVRSEKKFRIVF